jgi:hypothetical protein
LANSVHAQARRDLFGRHAAPPLVTLIHFFRLGPSQRVEPAARAIEWGEHMIAERPPPRPDAARDRIAVAIDVDPLPALTTIVIGPLALRSGCQS